MCDTGYAWLRERDRERKRENENKFDAFDRACEREYLLESTRMCLLPVVDLSEREKIY